MKKILFILSIALFISCNNNSNNKNDKDSATGSDVSNAAPRQGDTSSYERMSNQVDTSHQH